MNSSCSRRRYMSLLFTPGVPRHAAAVVSVLLVLVATGLTASAAVPPGADSATFDDLLATIEFNGSVDPAQLGARLAELDDEELGALCRHLAPPESAAADDTRVRMALHGLALHLGGQGRAEDRARFSRVLGSALQDAPHPDIARFLIHQLQLAGDESAVPALTAALSDEALRNTAVQALVTIGGGAAKRSLRAAYTDVDPEGRAMLAGALGGLRDRSSADLLARDLDSEHPALRAAVMLALVDLGDPRVADVLLAAPPEDADAHRRAQCLAAQVELARRLLERGAYIEAELLTAPGILVSNADEQQHVLCAALHVLAEAEGAHAIERIAGHLTSDDVEVRACATNIAVALQGPGVTGALVATLRGADSPAARAAVLEVLRRRGDPGAYPAARDALSDASADVRIAAIRAAAALGRAAAVNPLIDRLVHAGPDERAAIRRALVSSADPLAGAQIAQRLVQASPEVSVLLLEVLADSVAVEQADVVRERTTSVHADVRAAAVAALGRIGSEQDAPRLLSLLERATDAEREMIEKTLIQIGRRARDRAALGRRLVTRIGTGDERDYVSLLRVLGGVGGPVAFAAIREAIEDPRAAVQEAACRALLDWPDPGDAMQVLRIVKDAKPLNCHVLAFRAFIRLASREDAFEPSQRLQLYEAAFHLVRRVEEAKRLIAKIGEVDSQLAVDVLAPRLKIPSLRNEAGAAILNVAERLIPDDWPDAQTDIQMVLAADVTGPVDERASELRARLEPFQDFIKFWLIAGPYEIEGKRGDQLLDFPFQPEIDADAVEWQEHARIDDPNRYWYLDVHNNDGFEGNHKAAYFYVRVWSPAEQEVRLELGSDDGIKVWLNGLVVHENNILRGCERGQDIVPVRLAEHWNELLIKVTNNEGGWAALCRIRSPEGEHVEGLHYDDRRPASSDAGSSPETDATTPSR